MNVESFKISNYIGIIVSIILLYVAKFYYQYFTRPNPIPGPIPLPLIGNLLGLIYHVKGDMLVYYKFLYQRYGDIYELYVGESRQVVFARAEYIEELMSTSKQISNNILRVRRFGLDDLGLGPKKGIAFNRYPPTWKSNREFLLHTIKAPNFSKEVLYHTSKIFDELNGYLKVIGYDVPIDFVPWVRFLTYETVFQVIIGLKINRLVKHFNDNVEISKKKDFNPSPLDKEIITLYESIVEDLVGLGFVLSYPALIRRTLFKKRNEAMLYSKNRTIKILTKIINYRRKEIEETPVNEELRHDMLTSLIITNTERDFNEKNYIANESSEPLTNDQIEQILLEAIAGGSDTIASFICYVIHYLGCHSDVVARLRQEFNSIFGSDPNRQITMVDLSKMHYLEALIKESARHINQSKVIQRVSTKTSDVAGYKWSADTTFIIYAEGIHLNSNYWENPHEFNPDRFMGVEPQKNTFLMFGGGMRGCPGKKFALTEVKCLITLIFRSLDISLVDVNAPVKLKNDFMTTCAELMVKVKEREVQV